MGRKDGYRDHTESTEYKKKEEKEMNEKNENRRRKEEEIIQKKLKGIIRKD